MVTLCDIFILVCFVADTFFGVGLLAGTPSDCYTGCGSYRGTGASGLWVTTQHPSIDCLLCTACTPYDSEHSLTCTDALSSCGDVTNVAGQIIYDDPVDCQAAAATATKPAVLVSPGGSGAACYGSSQKWKSVPNYPGLQVIALCGAAALYMLLADNN